MVTITHYLSNGEIVKDVKGLLVTRKTPEAVTVIVGVANGYKENVKRPERVA